MRMTVRTEKCSIGEYDVRCTQMPAWDATLLLKDLSRHIGSLRHLSADITAESSITTLAPMIAELSGSMSRDDFGEMLLCLLGRTVVTRAAAIKGRKEKYELTSRVEIDRAFGADVGTLMKVVAFSFRTNFGDFWDAVAEWLPQAQEEASAQAVTAETQ